ncbi:hypothetical protein CDAR_116811 [Caerostris darwini]|uniref:Uncharacterized protein n=1 Tax=Caerostris darwini TaxID=1538125 RepID=A0AAV4WAT7_9ARAC|nr:hypothetical protein CDAR_116811 [Caerostris darwini]
MTKSVDSINGATDLEVPPQINSRMRGQGRRVTLHCNRLRVHLLEQLKIYNWNWGGIGDWNLCLISPFASTLKSSNESESRGFVTKAEGLQLCG